MYSFHHRWIRRFSIIFVIVLVLIVFIKRDAILDKVFNQVEKSSAAPVAKNIDNQSNDLAAKDYMNQQTIPVANNQPDFKQSELETQKGGWLDLSRRDWLGRSKQANAMLDKSRMPTEKRKRLTVKTPGYHVYQFNQAGQENYLYNRSHLIGYQLSGLNNDARNLVTGTVAFNAIHQYDQQQSMEDYENAIADYLKQSSKHFVRYQVTPLYRNVERVPRGVEMQAQSIGDDSIKFHVYVFNSQPGWQINYYTGTALQENGENK
ncbi:DNA/RNA non-specific endonuclease [Weissella paramesenteroides]|uniref:DNA/RNA non-specific endonuclease n=1 Tax=Weissella paramesenteroides TaxID=1249 RepID=UPI00223A7033|nr:DNA/RNA non-specific endonuclease [Weissella paramesenteroides]MCT0485857.1 DNA-entry nuclease [Weissella paramesenteroides]